MALDVLAGSGGGGGDGGVVPGGAVEVGRWR